jgi:Xaa-Pro aminopeptidase
MYPHQTERLDAALAAADVDAVIATLPADVAYLTGFRSFSRGVYPAQIAAVYAKAGTGLVIPTIDAPAFVTGDGAADHVACYGRFFVNVAERADEHVRRAASMAAEATETAG